MGTSGTGACHRVRKESGGGSGGQGGLGHKKGLGKGGGGWEAYWAGRDWGGSEGGRVRNGGEA